MPAEQQPLAEPRTLLVKLLWELSKASDAIDRLARTGGDTISSEYMEAYGAMNRANALREEWRDKVNSSRYGTGFMAEHVLPVRDLLNARPALPAPNTLDELNPTLRAEVDALLAEFGSAIS